MTERIKDQLKQSTAILDPYGKNIDFIVKFAEAQDVNEGLILATALFIVSAVVVLIHGWQIIVCCITVIYPALHSIRAIITEENTDDKEWLTYWMIYGLFTFVETFLGFILALIPYYDWIRLGIFGWLLLPQFRGAAHMYDHYVKDIVSNHKDFIEDLISRTTTIAETVQNEAKDTAQSAAKSALSDPNLVLKGVQMANDLKEKIADKDANEMK